MYLYSLYLEYKLSFPLYKLAHDKSKFLSFRQRNFEKIHDWIK